jgi:amino acid permease
VLRLKRPDKERDVAGERKIVMRPLTWVLLALAVGFVILALVYFTTTATNLPSFFPGHQPGVTKTHTKHGVAMLGFAVLALVGAWFTTAPARPSSP